MATPLPRCGRSSTCMVRPTFCCRRSALISRRQLHEARAPLGLELGGAPGFRCRALAAAPSTGEYSKQPTRSSCASRSHASSSSNSASVSPGKPTMKVLRSVMSGTARRQAAMRSQRVFRGGGALHQLQNAGAGMLEGNVEIGQHAACRHQLDHLDRRADRDRRSAAGSRRRARPGPAARS